MSGMARPLAVDAVIIKDGKLALIRRDNEPFRGCYALPGGYVEKGESVRSAVVREAKEETGLEVRPVRLVGIYDKPGRDRRGNVGMAYLCKLVKGKAMAGSDAASVGFFDTGRLPGKLAFDHDKIIMDALGFLKPRKVLAGGAFNLIHPGHLHFLEQAKRLGDELVVVVAHDRTVIKNGKKLLFPAETRAGLVGSVRHVDRVVIGNERDDMKVVVKEKPDVIAVGYDQDLAGMKGRLKKAGMRCRVVRIGKLKGYSTKSITGVGDA
jgi:8-oxo-dGTP diphosphatase